MPIKKVRDYYFAEKNYALIYIHRMFFRSGNQIISVFTGAYLYHSGFPLPLIILYFAAKFMVQGTSAIFCNRIIKSWGPPRGILVALMFFGISFFTMSQVAHNHLWAVPTLISHAIASGIYFSFADVMEAMYITYDKHRGRQFVFGSVVTSLVGSVAVALTAYILSNYSYLYAAIFAATCLAICAVPLFFLKAQKDLVHKKHTKRVLAVMKSKPFRPFIFTFFGEQFYTTARTIFIPLFIFMAIGEKFDTFGYLVVAASLTEIMVTLIFGNHIDKKGNRAAIRKSFWLNSFTSFLYVAVVSGPMSAFFTETVNRVADNSFMSAFRTGVHKRVRKKFELITFGAAWQAVLCYSGTITLITLAGIAYFVDMYVFLAVFVLRVWGVHLCSRFLHQFPHKK